MGDGFTQSNGKKGKYTKEMGAKGRATIAQNQAEIRAYKAKKKARKIKAKKLVASLLGDLHKLPHPTGLFEIGALPQTPGFSKAWRAS